MLLFQVQQITTVNNSHPLRW